MNKKDDKLQIHGIFLIMLSYLKLLTLSNSVKHIRGIANIPHHEYHIRFSPKDGRKRPAQDVLDRSITDKDNFIFVVL
uniref:Uncharacterized protein n=1 Tax=Heterorhabditis bacteriophora TaxID=37862 RepID=A0A1I7WWS2_HETBA